MKTLKWLAALLVGGVIVAIASKATIAVLSPAPAPTVLPAPTAPLSTTCSMQSSAVADCTIVLSRDPALYGATVEGMRGELLREWCAGLARRTDGARGDAVIHVLYPNRTQYADVRLQADECQ